ncbi:MAG: hypothetical protein AB4290_12900 [Spirulina sp.]
MKKLTDLIFSSLYYKIKGLIQEVRSRIARRSGRERGQVKCCTDNPTETRSREIPSNPSEIGTLGKTQAPD